MIKIIKEGKKENYKFKKTCSVCGCEFEYELRDLYKDYDYNQCLTSYPPQYRYTRYINCPCCGEKIVHDSGADQDVTPLTISPIDVKWTAEGTGGGLDCESCANKPDPNNPVFGDTPCTLCKKMTPSCK